jgi:hypothetical protein
MMTPQQKSCLTCTKYAVCEHYQVLRKTAWDRLGVVQGYPPGELTGHSDAVSRILAPHCQHYAFNGSEVNTKEVIL